MENLIKDIENQIVQVIKSKYPTDDCDGDYWITLQNVPKPDTTHIYVDGANLEAYFGNEPLENIDPEYLGVILICYINIPNKRIPVYFNLP